MFLFWTVYLLPNTCSKFHSWFHAAYLSQNLVWTFKTFLVRGAAELYSSAYKDFSIFSSPLLKPPAYISHHLKILRNAFLILWEDIPFLSATLWHCRLLSGQTSFSWWQTASSLDRYLHLEREIPLYNNSFLVAWPTGPSVTGSNRVKI